MYPFSVVRLREFERSNTDARTAEAGESQSRGASDALSQASSLHFTAFTHEVDENVDLPGRALRGPFGDDLQL